MPTELWPSSRALGRSPAAGRRVEDDILAGAADLLHRVGCTSVLFARMPSNEALGDGRIIASTHPKAWVETFVARRYHRVCPLVRNVRRSERPFAWSDVTAWRRLGAAEREVVEHARSHGMGEGFVVPFRCADDTIEVVSLAGTHMELSGAVRELLTHTAQQLRNELSRLGRETPRLSRREAEIVQWIASGKSDWQVGQILAISAKTVNYHVENVKRKFAVATRLQAVVRAVQTGQVAV